MKLALDTNGYVAFCKGEKKAIEVLAAAHSLLFPFICVAELRAGFLGGKKSLQNEINDYFSPADPRDKKDVL